MFINSASAQYLPLYKTIPNFIEAPNNEVEATTGGILRISKVSVPGYQFFSAGSDGTKPCVVICPGGGYGILAASHEGTDVAKYFNSIGVHALVLKYRIPSAENQQQKEWAPLQDAQQAMHLVRQNAKKWNVDPAKVGIMGFSAGGHLASTLATHYEDRKIKAKSSISFRPDFQILLYPVISFGKFAHKGSRNNLLSPDTTAEKIAYFSNELHVNKQSPPAFLVHAKDDKAVPVENSLIYAQQLKDNGIEAEVFLYEAGGHGFGMKNSTSAVKWTDSLKSWLEKNSILK
jgi:acetyl esterase/lipase